MAGSNDSFQVALASALNIDVKDVPAKLEKLSIGQMNTVINAVSDGNESEIDSIFAAADKASPDDVHPLLATNTPAPTTPVSPADPEAAPGAPQDAQEQPQTDDDGDDDEQTNEAAEGPNEGFYSHGDLVWIDGETKASVATPRGPNGTIGCIVPGKSQRMYASDRVTRCDENILGAAMLPELLRMQVLAGMAPSYQNMPVQVARIRTTDVPGAPATQSRAIAVQTDVTPIDPVEDIEDAFAEIMDKLPEVKQRDIKKVRAMVNNVTTSINEDRFGFLKSLKLPS